MIGQVEFESVQGFSFILNDDRAPMQEFSMEVDWRFNEYVKAQTHGIHMSNSLLGKRVVRCRGEILGDSTADYLERRMEIMRAITPWAEGDGLELGTLKIPFDGIEERLTAACTLETYPELPIAALSPARGEYLIVFKAFDPRLYGEQEKTLDMLPGSDQLGYVYPRVYPREYTIPISSAPEYFITNSGTVETWVSGTFYGPCESPALRITGYGGVQQTFQLNNLILGPTDYVEFDLNERTAVMNGGTNVFNYAEGSEWWSLPIGSWPIEYIPFDWDTTTHCTLSWHNAYNL